MLFWRQSLATAIAFIATLTMVRLIGKKEVSQMTFWDLVSALTVGALAANMVIDRETPLWMGVWVVALWGALTLVADWGALRNRWFRGLVQGKPTVVIQNGKILEESMRSERYNADILLSHLRSQGVFNVADVEFGVLEPDGKLSVLLKSQNLPVTARDLHLPTE